MDNRCDVCGCISDEGSLKEYELDGKKFNVCNFCRKQLDALPDGKEASRNLLFMDTKGKRSVECHKALTAFLQQNGVNTIPDEVAPPVVPAPAVKNAVAFNGMANNNQIPPQNLPLDKQVAQLRQQVDELADKWNKFRRRYILSKVLGIVIPIVLIIIVFIIMIASGALGNLADYFGTISDLANEM